MKICIVCPRLCHGGAERVAVSLANGFVARGHEVIFFADLYEEQTYTLDESVQVQNLVSQTNNKLKKWGEAIRLLRKQLKKDKPDVIIGIMSLCSIVAQLASMGLGIPVIATEHNSYDRPSSIPLSKWEYIYKFYISKIFTCVTVLTKADMKYINGRLNNAVVIPNPLSMRPLHRDLNRDSIILAAGRVDSWHIKGFDVLIRAWARVVSSSEFLVSNEGWKLVIAGVWRNPETRTYLDGIANECGVLDRIEYTGFIEDMQNLYAKTSIFVLSSRNEGMPMVLLEAMSQGCACIATDFKGRSREIMCPQGQGSMLNVQGSNNKVELCETGILCEPDDVESLAAGLQKMIEDDEYRESVRAKAIERSKYYSIENTMDRWEALLKQVTGVKQL